MAAQVAEGLAELHRNNLVHGHLRPESIIVTKEGDVRLTGLDAGQFKQPGWSDDVQDIYALSYLSPEQINHSAADSRSDIFSFGVLLYELLTGELPFQGKNRIELSQAIRFDALPPFDHIKARIPIDAQNLISKCLHKDPGQRLQNAGDLVREIQELLYRSKDIESDANVMQDAVVNGGQSSGQKKRKHRVIIPAIVVISIAVIGYFICKEYFPSQGKVIDVIVLDDIELTSTSQASGRVTPEILEYLLVDDLMQSGDVTVMKNDEFKFLHPGKTFPRLVLDGSIHFNGVGYNINLEWTPQKGQSRTRPYDFVDPSALLTHKIPEMTTETLQLVGIKEKKKSTFTTAWDAFESFFEGEKSWERLDLTDSEQKYKQSLHIDPEFVLAKLRLAGVLQFNGSNDRAQKLVQSIQSSLGELSIVDSLKAEALTARLTGDLRQEINILRNIYNRFPTSKEAPYEVAEAYYAICDIKNAIDFYLKALALDERFARAHNHLAYCYSHRGKHEIALHHFRTYVALDSSANAFDSLGDGYMAAGKLDSAAWAKQQGIRLDPKLAYLYGALAYIQIRQGKFEDANRSVEKYIANSPDKDNQSNGYSRLALIKYCSRNYKAALAYALKGLDTFDSNDLVTRNHELHWLLGLIYLERDQFESAKGELARMEAIIDDNGVNSTNYRMGILKYAIHLRAAIAAKEGDAAAVLESIKMFDGPLQEKIKDHGSPFDLAFFYTTFGELLSRPPLNQKTLAMSQFEKALKYNPNYALAHFNKWRLQKASEGGGQENLDAFKSLWKDADAAVLALYDVDG